jgi:hypothetical protein
MPTEKQTYLHFSAPPQLVLDKLPLLEHNLANKEYAFIGKDFDGEALLVEMLRGWATEYRKWDSDERIFRAATFEQSKVLTFTIRNGYLEAPSIRAAKHFSAAMGFIGLSMYPLRTVEINLLDWLKASLMLHATSQLGSITISGLRDDNFVGKFDAKSIEHRIDMDYIIEHADGLRSVRLGWFDNGLRCSVTATSGGKLECSCRDEEYLPELFDIQRRLYLSYAVEPPVATLEVGR